MKTDRLLLVAIVGVMAVVAGYLLFSDEGGEKPQSMPGLQAQVREGETGTLEQIGGQRDDVARAREGALEIAVPAGWNGGTIEQMAAYLGVPAAQIGTFGVMNQGRREFPAGGTVWVPLAVHDALARGPIAPGPEDGLGGREDNRGSDPTPVGGEVRGTGNGTTARPEPKAAPKTNLPPDRQVNPWNKFLMAEDAPIAEPASVRNVQPVSSSARKLPLSDTPKPQHAYKVRSGENLWKISERAYGNGGRWKEILVANSGLLDPAKEGADLGEGMILVIP